MITKSLYVYLMFLFENLTTSRFEETTLSNNANQAGQNLNNLASSLRRVTKIEKVI